MRIGSWIVRLTKRMLKRQAFWALLALMLALTLVYSAVAREDAGMVTIALAREDEADVLADHVMQSLESSSRILRFLPCATPQRALQLVAEGRADCAWVFHSQMRKNVTQFLRTRSQEDAFVTVYQREETVLLRLARERLNAQVYTAIAQQLYLHGLDEASDAMLSLSKSEKLAYWENAQIPGELFDFQYQGDAPEPQGYLLSPIRGLLAVVVLLGALSNALYAQRDTQMGIFCYLFWRVQWLPELIGGLLSQLALCAGVGLCLGLTGLWGSFWREVVCLVGLVLSTTGFSMAVKRLLPGTQTMAAALPVILVVSLVACPVFFFIAPLAPVGALLPVSHYLNAAAGDASFGWLILYSGICFAIALIPRRMR